MKALSPPLLCVALLALHSGFALGEEAADYITSESDWKKLRDGEVILVEISAKILKSERAKEDQHAAAAAILVEAPPTAVWKVIADKEAAPEYIESLESATIIEDNAEYQLIEQVMKLGPLPRVTYVVKHTPLPPHTVQFERHSGDLKSISGFWKMLPVDGGKKCLVVYRLALKPGFLVPNFVMRNALKKSLPDALRAVRDRALQGTKPEKAAPWPRGTSVGRPTQ